MYFESPIKRRKSRQIMVGNVPVGGDAPISVQSMTNTETTDVAATVEQIQRIQLAGADIVRVSVPSMEAAEALRVGALEIDMVLNIGRLKSGDRASVQADIVGVRQVVHANGGTLKVILETSLLTIDEKIIACQLSLAAGADFVKTSTGFAGGGATVDDIALMRGVVGDRMGVKASGGIRSAADALERFA